MQLCSDECRYTGQSPHSFQKILPADKQNNPSFRIYMASKELNAMFSELLSYVMSHLLFFALHLERQNHFPKPLSPAKEQECFSKGGQWRPGSAERTHRAQPAAGGSHRQKNTAHLAVTRRIALHRHHWAAQWRCPPFPTTREASLQPTLPGASTTRYLCISAALKRPAATSI